MVGLTPRRKWRGRDCGKAEDESRELEVMRVLFAGGGTGGHIFPAVAIIEALKERRSSLEPLFILGSGGRGSHLLEQSGVPWETVPVKGMPRKNPVSLVPFLVGVVAAVVRSLRLIRRWKPSVVVAVGGYASAPVAFAGSLLRIPVFVAEQNMVAGVATRWNARFADRIFLAYDDARRTLPANRAYTVSGNPVRADVLQGDRRRAEARWELDPEKKTVLISGGSQGARTLNKIVQETLNRWERPAEVQFLFQTGSADYEEIRESCSRIDVTVRVVPFLADMGDAYGAADLVVCRAGASTLAEITALGLPSILVPLPWAADDHQTKNAGQMVRHGAALCFDQASLDGDTLGTAITELLGDDAKRTEMSRRSRELGRPEAARTIADSILALSRAGGRGKGRNAPSTGGPGNKRS